VPGEPRVRRLGVGPSGGGDRPLRAQVVVALVCVMMLIAVPLYLMRKPSTKASAPALSASVSAATGPQAVPKPSAEPGPAPAAPPRLTLEECAPKTKSKGSINYVLTVDFTRKKLHVYPGASGEWRGKQARRAANCVKSAIKAPDWNAPHQYRYYALAILATYAGPPGSLPIPVASGQSALPNFE
jgi:hypothetical protein